MPCPANERRLKINRATRRKYEKRNRKKRCKICCSPHPPPAVRRFLRGPLSHHSRRCLTNRFSRAGPPARSGGRLRATRQRRRGCTQTPARLISGAAKICDAIHSHTDMTRPTVRQTRSRAGCSALPLFALSSLMSRCRSCCGCCLPLRVGTSAARKVGPTLYGLPAAFPARLCTVSTVSSAAPYNSELRFTLWS